MTNKYIKEIIAALIIATITGAFTKISYLEKEISNLASSSETVISDVKMLKISRENLSDYYVTRREFNANVENWNKKSDEQGKKLEKIIDILMSK